MASAPGPTWSAETRGLVRFVKVVLAIALLAVATFVVWLLLPPTPAPLPPGATALELRTQATGFGARIVLQCPAAAFPDMMLGRSGTTATFRRMAGSGGAEIEPGPWVYPVWPAGWSARLVDGRAELVTPDGFVLAREGDIIRHPGGGNGWVCLAIGSLPAVHTAVPTVGATSAPRSTPVSPEP
jgi:hypothetical protein